MYLFILKFRLIGAYFKFLNDNLLYYNTIPNHSDTVFIEKDKTFICGALEKGVEIRDINSERGYPTIEDKRRIIALRPQIPYSENEKGKIIKLCKDYKDTPYQYRSLIQHILKITWLGKWLGLRGEAAKKRVFCIELTANIINDVRPNTFKNPEQINPVEIFINPYHIVEKDFTIINGHN